MNATIFVKSGREKSLLQHHPWIFSGSIDHIKGAPGLGETVRVCAGDGQFLGYGAFSPNSQIRVRLWSFDEQDTIDAAWFHKRLAAAIELRAELKIAERTEAYRLVYAESDGLPGLVVDRYGDTLVLQLLAAGAAYWKETLVSQLKELTGLDRVLERSDVDVRQLEGLDDFVGVLSGEIPSDPMLIHENGLAYAVDLFKGHKTGFYLDQRNNRAKLKQYAQDRDILNCFSYTGGFAVSGLAGGARSVLSVDSSADVLKLGAENVAHNALPAERAEWLEGDVFQVLRKLRDQARSFDLIVLDPPKFAPTIAQVERAARGYKDINLLAFKLLRPGGILFTFSCSGGVSADLFQKIVAGAALDAKVDAKILETMTQAEDHPVALSFPEGAYLKGLVCRV